MEEVVEEEGKAKEEDFGASLSNFVVPPEIAGRRVSCSFLQKPKEKREIMTLTLATPERLATQPTSVPPPCALASESLITQTTETKLTNRSTAQCPGLLALEGTPILLPNSPTDPPTNLIA